MKKFFKRSLPSVSELRTHPRLQFFGTLLHDPNLWHFNRRSLSGGMAVGLFTAFIPLPMQMLWAALLAIYFRVNLPLSVSLIWVTNPITIPPLFYFAYKVGTILLGIPTQHLEFKFSQDWLFQTLNAFWQPLLLGSLTLGFLSALSGYLLINLLWRLQVSRSWRNRRERQRLKKRLAAQKRRLKKLENVP